MHLEEARQLIEKALSIRPKDAYIMDSMGWVCFQEGKLKEAEGYIQKALRVLPNEPTVNEHMGDLYLKRGQKTKALYHYNRAFHFGKKQEKQNKKELDRVEEKIRALGH